MQAQLKAEYYADLMELRHALVNTMACQPDKADRMRPKLTQVDNCIAIFEVGARSCCGCCWSMRVHAGAMGAGAGADGMRPS